MLKTYKKKGSIGITIVMMVFCLLMAVSMSYHKTLQTENTIKNHSNYSDRAMDAAFSGVNYAMSLIQSDKKVFTQSGYKFFLKSKDDGAGTGNHEEKMYWITPSQEFENYFDEDRKEANKKKPPYRFILSCKQSTDNKNYNPDPLDSTKIIIYIKSIGEYTKYEKDESGDEEKANSYYAQILAKCIINTKSKTIILNKYKKVYLQKNDDSDYPEDSFFALGTEEINDF